MRAAPSGIAQATALELVITRVFEAPPDLVFKMWSRPEHFMRWLGPRGFSATSVTMDVRPGGTWRATIRSEEGRSRVFFGTYHEVVEPDRLVFTLAWEGNRGPIETLVSVTFGGGNGKTFMTFCQVPFRSAEERDASYAGWNQEFDKLDVHIRSLEAARREKRRVRFA